MRYPLAFLLVLSGCSVVPIGREPASGPGGELDGLWVLQIRRQTWKPRDLEFVLRVEEDNDGVHGMATVDPVFVGRTTASLSDLTTDGDSVRFALHSRMDDFTYRFDGRLAGGALDGEVRWNDRSRDQTDVFTAYRRDVRRFDTTLDRFPVEHDPRGVGIEPVLLDRLVLGAEVARSDALIVLADGRLVAARTFGGGDAETSVDSLSDAIGALAVEDGASGLQLRPSELAAVGQALLDGHWTGAPALPDGWIERMAAVAANSGLAPGRSWTDLPDPTDPQGPPLGFGKLTSAGEGLLVYPEARLVVVRTMHRAQNQYDRRYDARDRMEWLDEMTESIAVEKLGRPPFGGR